MMNDDEQLDNLPMTLPRRRLANVKQCLVPCRQAAQLAEQFYEALPYTNGAEQARSVLIEPLNGPNN